MSKDAGEVGRYADLLLDAEKLLKDIPSKELGSTEFQELKSMSAAMHQAADAVRGLREDDLINVSNRLTKLIDDFSKTREWLSENYGGVAKAVLNELYDVKGFVTALGVRYFSRESMRIPLRKRVLIVVLLVLFVFVGVGAGVAAYIVYRKKLKKQQGSAASITSKKSKTGAYEITNLTSIYGKRPNETDVSSFKGECSYTFLVSMVDVDESSSSTSEAAAVLFTRKVAKAAAGATSSVSHVPVISISCFPRLRKLELRFASRDATPVYCSVEIEDLPLYKWFVLHAVVTDTNAKMYINGRMVRNFYTHTCGFMVESQAGTHLEFPAKAQAAAAAGVDLPSPFLQLRYFKLHPGLLDEAAVTSEASELLQEVSAEKEQTVRDKCKTVSR